MKMTYTREYHIRNRYGFFLGVSLSLILNFIPLLGISQDFGKNKRPNFLVILTDDQTYRAIGYNNKLVKTPNLDKLASEGIIFDNFYAATPVCVASRASFLTGVYPQTNGTVALNTESFIKNIVKEKKFKTLPQYLAESGYTTYFSGKSHLGDPKHYGFQHGVETFEYDDQKAFKNATAMIRNTNFGSTPFLLWLAPRQPHVPLKPTNEWLDLYDAADFPAEPNFLTRPPHESFYNQGLPGENFYRDTDYIDNYKNLPAGPPRSIEQIKDFTKAYYATISHLDFQIGQIINELKKKSLLQNTIIIFLSDNGYFLGNHGLGNKLTMQEESVKVPMFVFWNQLKNKNTRCESLASSVDLFPTILDLAGINIPGYLQGASLRPVFSNNFSQIHKYVVSESVGVGGELGTGHRMVVSRKWKYILSDTGDEALYNLEEDPYELKNVIGDHRNHKRVQRLKTYLTNWKKLTGDKKSIPRTT